MRLLQREVRLTFSKLLATNMNSAICVLHLAEPELGVKAIVRRLGPQHPSIDTRTVRDVLQKMKASPREEEEDVEKVVEEEDDVLEEEEGDVEEEDDDELPLTRFSRVELHGLSRAELNGRHGFVGLRDATSGRLYVRLMALAGEPQTVVLVKESNIATVHHAEHPTFSALSRTPLKTSVSTERLSGEAAQMYSQIWSGEHLSFNVEHRAGGRGGVIQVTVLPEAGIPGTAEQRTLQLSLLSLYYNMSGAGATAACQVATDAEYLKDIGDMFMPLARRVMHLTLRNLDIDLGPILRNMCERELNSAYREEKRWPELVDLFCYSIETALAGEYAGYFSSDGVDRQSQLESRLAEVLEACGRFKEAALLYLESAHILQRHDHNESYQAQSIHNAGLAYKRAGMYNEAEALYHQSLRTTLRHSEQTFGQIPKSLHVGLENMLTLYMAKTAAKVGNMEAEVLSNTRAEEKAKRTEEIKNQSLNRKKLRLGARVIGSTASP